MLVDSIIVIIACEATLSYNFLAKPGVFFFFITLKNVFRDQILND